MATPDLRPDQDPQEYAAPRLVRTSPRLTRRQAQDLLAVLACVLGVVGLGFAAFAWDWRAGLAAVSLAVLAAGVRLGADR